MMGKRTSLLSWTSCSPSCLHAFRLRLPSGFSMQCFSSWRSSEHVSLGHLVQSASQRVRWREQSISIIRTQTPSLLLPPIPMPMPESLLWLQERKSTAFDVHDGCFWSPFILYRNLDAVASAYLWSPWWLWWNLRLELIGIRATLMRSKSNKQIQFPKLRFGKFCYCSWKCVINHFIF